MQPKNHHFSLEIETNSTMKKTAISLAVSWFFSD